MIVALESQCKWISAPSARNPVVDEERMRPSYWLGSVLFLFLHCFDTVRWWQEGHHLEQVEGENWGGIGWPRFTCKNS